MSGSSLLKGTAIVSGLTAVSRILGFVRDLLMAHLFGASRFADIFFVAFRIPNTLRSFIAEGALTSAFIPVLADELEAGRERAQQFFKQTVTYLLLLCLTLCIAGYYFATEVVLIFAPGFAERPGALSTAARLFCIMLPFIPSISLVALINGLLTSLKHYGAGALAQILVNCCFIGGILTASYFPPESQAECIAWAICIAALLQYLMLSYFASQVNFSSLPEKPQLLPAVRKMFLLMLPALFGAAVYQLSILINTAFASLLPTGGISWLFYADRIAQLPIGVFTIALSSVLLPRLAESHAKNNQDEVEGQLLNSLRYTIYILVPISLGMSVIALPIVQLLFERGAFTPTDSAQTGLALSVYALGIVPLSLYTLLSRHLFAQKKPAIPTLIGIFSLSISIFTALLTLGPISFRGENFFAQTVIHLQSLLPVTYDLGHEGLALASVSAAVFSLISYLLVVIVLEKRDLSTVLTTAIRSLIAGALMYGACTWINSLNLTPLFNLLSCVLSSCAIYFGTTLLMGMEEAKSVLKMMVKRGG